MTVRYIVSSDSVQDKEQNSITIGKIKYSVDCIHCVWFMKSRVEVQLPGL